VDPRLATLQREIASSIAGLTPGDLTCSVPGKWCSAEILEHLYLTYTGTAKGFSRLLEVTEPRATKATWKQRGRSFVVTQLGYMPTGRKAPAMALPRGIAPEKVTSEIHTAISHMHELMTLCARRFGTRSKVLDHPILGPLSIEQWRKFHLVHGLHHVKQIRRLRADLSAGRISKE
jgi:Protein of unknown function (DUF1569)